MVASNSDRLLPDLEALDEEDRELDTHVEEFRNTPGDWPCNCVFCRLLIHPILRAVSGLSLSKTEELAILKEKEIETNVDASISSGDNPREVNGGGKDNVVHEGVQDVNQVNSKAPTSEMAVQSVAPNVASIIERVDSLEKEVSNLKNNVHAMIEGIKATLVDLRAAVAEVSNPFNIMRKYAELLGTNQSMVPQPQSQQVITPQQYPVATNIKHEHAEDRELGGSAVGTAKPELPSESDEVSGKAGTGKDDLESVISSLISRKDEESEKSESEADEVEKGAGEDEAREVLGNSLKELIVSESARKLGLGKFLKLIKWIDTMLDRVPADNFETLIKFAAHIGVLSEGDVELVLNAVDLAMKARAESIRIDDQLIALYTLAKIFGLEDKEADDEIVKLAVNRDDALTKFMKALE